VRRLKAGASWEREQAAERRSGPPVTGKFGVTLHLTTAERVRLAAHLAESASNTDRAHQMGGWIESTAQVVDVLERIAAAVAAGTNDAPAVVVVRLDAEQGRRVRGVLKASQERAGDTRGLGEALQRIVAQWEDFTGWRQAVEDAEAVRPPREAAGGGGWTAA
jgi:hypothetical protein